MVEMKIIALILNSTSFFKQIENMKQAKTL